MTDANKYYLDKREAEQEEYDFKDEYEDIAADNVRLEARVEELAAALDSQIEWVKRLADDLIEVEAKLAKATDTLARIVRGDDDAHNWAIWTLAGS
jgi:predicted  nucleic acid-binding Zn-ribbon protein